MIIPFFIGNKAGANTEWQDALPVNMYAVKKDILGAEGYVTTYPGLEAFGTGIGKDRGGFYNERFNLHFRVSGTSLIKVDAFGNSTTLGTINGTEQVSLPYSFNTQAIIGNGKMFLYDGTNGFRQVTDANIGIPIDGTWINGRYFLTDGEYLYHTDVDDETSIDALTFATAEFMPDPCLGVEKTSDNKIIAFGRYTMEYFVDVATENFAFKRVETRAQKLGIVATHAKCEINNQWVIVGGRKTEGIFVYLVGLGNAVKLSSKEVDRLLSKYNEDDLADVRIESRLEKDNQFAIIHLPEETLLLNLTIAQAAGPNNSWSILKTGNEDTVYRGINGIFDPRLGKWIYGDKESDNLGTLNDTLFSQYGNNSEFYFYSPMMKLEGSSVDEIELQINPGFNDIDDARVAIASTQDGVIYTADHWMDYGTQNVYTDRFIARRLGYVRDKVGFRFRGVTTSKMSFALFDLKAS